MQKNQNNTALEIGPIACFAIAYFFGDRITEIIGIQDSFIGMPIFFATLTLMIVTPIAIGTSWLLYKKMPIMPVITLVVVTIFGAMTLYLQDDFFIKIKPTIINCLFAATLMGGHLFGRSFLQMILGGSFDLSDDGWKKLTIRWSLFFLFLAVVNEYVWRNYSEAFWVGFKLWGMTGLSFIFIVSQMPMIMKHTNKQKE